MMAFSTLSPKSVRRLLDLETTLREKHRIIIKNMSIRELKSFSKVKYRELLVSEMGELLPQFEESEITSTCQCIANALNSECEDQIRQYKRKASVINGNENKPDKALNLEVTIPDNCKLTTENTKNNTANTEHLLSNSSQQIFIFQNDFSIETTDDILDEDETANLSDNRQQ